MCGVLWGVFFAQQILPNLLGLFHISSNILGLSSVFVREYLCGAVGMKEAKPKKKMCYMFLSFGRYLRIPLPGRGAAGLAINQFSSFYIEFCNMTSPRIMVL